ncbi:hypothetical protein GCM10023347_27700 [Streptomyces chumphonensis]
MDAIIPAQMFLNCPNGAEMHSPPNSTVPPDQGMRIAEPGTAEPSGRFQRSADE